MCCEIAGTRGQARGTDAAHTGCPQDNPQPLLDYAIFRRSSGEPLSSVQLHVLARAYRAAWRALFACDPVGAHAIEALDLLLVFESPDRGQGLH
jgi:hypothetical protein